MPARVTCVFCRSVHTDLPDSARGTSVNCPNCGALIRVPEEAPVIARRADPPRHEDDDEPLEPRRSRPRPESKKSSLGIILGTIALLLFLFCGGGMALFYFMVIRPVADTLREFEGKNPPGSSEITSIDGAIEAMDRPTEREAALAYLGRAPFDPARASDVADALDKHQPDGTDPNLVDTHLEALMVWADPRHTAYLDRLTSDLVPAEASRTRMVRIGKAYRKLGDTRKAARVLAWPAFLPPQDREAQQELRACGQDGLRQALEFINHQDPSVGREAERFCRTFDRKDSSDRINEQFLARSLADLALEPLARGPQAARRIRELQPSMAGRGREVVPILCDHLLKAPGGLPGSRLLDELGLAIAAWAMKEDAPVIARTVERLDSSHACHWRLYETLTKLKNPQTAPTLVAGLGMPNIRGMAYAALAEMGEAVRPALEAGTQTGTPFARQDCQALLNTLDAKGKKGTRPGAPPSEEKPIELVDRLEAARTDAEVQAMFAELLKVDPGPLTPRQRDAVISLIAVRSKSRPDAVVQTAVAALDRWAEERHAANVAGFLIQHPTAEVVPLIRKLGQWKVPAVISTQAILTAAEVPANTEAAIEAVKSIGPLAEPEVLRRLRPVGTTDEKQVPLIRILEEIGTRRSIPRLEAFIRFQERRKDMPKALAEARKTLSSIKKREG